MTEQLTPSTQPVETDEVETATAEDETVDEPMAAAETPVEAAAAPEAGPEPAEEPAPEPVVEATAAPEAGPEPAVEAEPAAERAPQPEPEPAAAPKRERRAAAVEGVDASERPAGPRGLQLKYRTDVVPALVKQFEYSNPNQVPRLEKIVVNVGLGEALTNAKAIDAASGDLTTITGQKPIVLKARRSIAQFRVRTGNPIGLKVTLRGQRMWDFLERLTMLALPRIRDFRGTPSRSFDGRGNYTLGLREQIAFPEIDYDKVDRLRGLEVSIVTTAKSDEESKRLLELLGMPFAG
jgi:large subunit ribosomal protein L5